MNRLLITLCLLLLVANAVPARAQSSPADRLVDRVDRLTENTFARPDLDLPLRHTYVYYLESLLVSVRPESLRPAMERILATETGGRPVDLSTLANDITLDMLGSVRLAAGQVLATLDGAPVQAQTLIALDQAGLFQEDPYVGQLLAAHAATLLVLSGEPSLADALAESVDDPYGRLVWQLAGLELAIRAGDRAAARSRLATAATTFALIDDPDNRVYYAGLLATLAKMLGQDDLAQQMRREELDALETVVSEGGALDYGALGLVRRTLMEEGVETAARRLRGVEGLVPPTLKLALTAVIADHRTGRLPPYVLTAEPDVAFQYALTLSELAIMTHLTRLASAP